MRKFLILGLVFTFIGCAAASRDIVKPFVDPQYGMSKIEMFNLLGKPEKIEIYKETNSTRLEFYFYVRNYQSSQESIPVCIINNKVAGWGKTFYEDHVSLDDTRIR